MAALILVVFVALAFDFFNGFHDAANSFAALLLGTKVAATIAKDVVDQNVLAIGVIFSGLMGAIAWDIITWWFGLPTSSSHALVGGLIGAGVVKGGWGVVQVAGVSKIILF